MVKNTLQLQEIFLLQVSSFLFSTLDILRLEKLCRTILGTRLYGISNTKNSGIIMLAASLMAITLKPSRPSSMVWLQECRRSACTWLMSSHMPGCRKKTCRPWRRCNSYSLREANSSSAPHHNIKNNNKSSKKRRKNSHLRQGERTEASAWILLSLLNRLRQKSLRLRKREQEKPGISLTLCNTSNSLQILRSVTALLKLPWLIWFFTLKIKTSNLWFRRIVMLWTFMFLRFSRSQSCMMMRMMKTKRNSMKKELNLLELTCIRRKAQKMSSFSNSRKKMQISLPSTNFSEIFIRLTIRSTSHL